MKLCRPAYFVRATQLLPHPYLQVRVLPREGPEGVPPARRLLGEHQERLLQGIDGGRLTVELFRIFVRISDIPDI